MARDRSRKGWLSSLMGGKSDPPGTRYELAVLEGADAGASFQVDQPQIQIGRRVPGSVRSDGIELNDKSVSGRHAIIGCEDGRVTVEHLPSATNPTLVNGRRVTRKRIRDGDRIVLGLVVLELRTHLPEEQAIATADRASAGEVARFQISTEPVNARAELVLRDGLEELIGEHFPLIRRHTSIGRDEDCDIVLDIAAVSRVHAALVWEDDQLVLVHESAVNPTHVNGMPVRDRRRVFDGDQIELSERVRFQVSLVASEVSAPTPVANETPPADADTRLTSPPPPGDAEATRIEPTAPATGDATQLTPVPDRARYADAEATRIAPVPGGAADASAADTETQPDAGDADATLIRRSPVADAEAEAARDADEAKTMIRPSPFADSERTLVRSPAQATNDAEATIIHSPPEAKATPAPDETVIFNPAEEEEDPDR